MTTPIVIGTLWGMSAAKLADALAPADPDRCGWLDGCTVRHDDGDWLCRHHRRHLKSLRRPQ